MLHGRESSAQVAACERWRGRAGEVAGGGGGRRHGRESGPRVSGQRETGPRDSSGNGAAVLPWAMALVAWVLNLPLLNPKP